MSGLEGVYWTIPILQKFKQSTLWIKLGLHGLEMDIIPLIHSSLTNKLVFLYINYMQHCCNKQGNKGCHVNPFIHQHVAELIRDIAPFTAIPKDSTGSQHATLMPKASARYHFQLHLDRHEFVLPGTTISITITFKHFPSILISKSLKITSD